MKEGRKRSGGALFSQIQLSHVYDSDHAKRDAVAASSHSPLSLGISLESSERLSFLASFCFFLRIVLTQEVYATHLRHVLSCMNHGHWQPNEAWSGRDSRNLGRPGTAVQKAHTRWLKTFLPPSKRVSFPILPVNDHFVWASNEVQLCCPLI